MHFMKTIFIAHLITSDRLREFLMTCNYNPKTVQADPSDILREFILRNENRIFTTIHFYLYSNDLQKA